MPNLRLLLPIMFLILVACTPRDVLPEPPAAELVSDSAQVGAPIPNGEPIQRELKRRIETVTNCGTTELLITKHVSMSTITSHGLRWEVNGHFGTGLTVGKGVVPGGVDLEAAFDVTSGIDFQGGLQHTTSWDLPAPHDTEIHFTMAWFEYWQPGYIDVTLADKSITRIDVEYRVGVFSDVVGQLAYDCSGNQITVEVTPVPLSQPTPTILGISESRVPAPAPGAPSPTNPPAAQPSDSWSEPGPGVSPIDPTTAPPVSGLAGELPLATPIPSRLNLWIPPGPDRYPESNPGEP